MNENVILIGTLVHMFCAFAGLAFIFCDVARIRAQKGSLERYRMASICRVLQWPTLAWPAVGIIMSALLGSYFLMAFNAYFGYVIVKRVLDYRKSDEDDFWNKMGKRLKRKIKAWVQQAADSLVPQPAMVPIPVRR